MSNTDTNSLEPANGPVLVNTETGQKIDMGKYIRGDANIDFTDVYMWEEHDTLHISGKPQKAKSCPTK